MYRSNHDNMRGEKEESLDNGKCRQTEPKESCGGSGGLRIVGRSEVEEEILEDKRKRGEQVSVFVSLPR